MADQLSTRDPLPSTRLIILDRDGVVNELVPDNVVRGPRKFSELSIREDFLWFIREISETRLFQFAVVTNQPDIARGVLTKRENKRLRTAIEALFPASTLYLECPHDNEAGCDCRKPRPGMLLEALRYFDSSADNAIFVGDMWTDVLAGQRAGVFTVLLKTEHGYRKTSAGSPPAGLQPDLTLNSLRELSLLLSPAAEK